LEAALVSSNDEANNARAKARELAIEAAVRACRDDGRALAAFGTFLWALANRGDVAAGERAFLDAVLAAGGDWVAAKSVIGKIGAPQTNSTSSRDDDSV
jgi:hypothetical protein